MGIPDVDLDVVDRDKVLKHFPGALVASQLSADKRRLVPHNTGVYFQNMPIDPLIGLVTFPYDVAEDLGYYKVDFIPFHIYELVDDEDHLNQMVAFAESDEFPWRWFQQDRFFTNTDTKKRVTHIGSYGDLCKQYPPKTVVDVAALIALIRPRKKYLIGEDWSTIMDKIWQKLPDEETGKSGNYFFKKSHAVGYALAVLVHLQLLDQAEFM